MDLLVFYCSKLARTMKTAGYCSKMADSIEPVFTPKDALYRNLDSQRVSGSLKISRGGQNLPPGTGRVKNQLKIIRG